MDTDLRRDQEITRSVIAFARSQHARRLRADRRKWAQARSLAGVGELMADWLEGKILHQPGYGDPELGEEPGPDPETGGLVPVLAACCRAGFVTTCSQPGEILATGRGTWRQRAAVEGFCHAATAFSLSASARMAGLKVITHSPSSVPRRRISHDRAVVVSDSDGKPFTSFGSQLSRAHLRDPHLGYGGCHRDAVRDITSAWQVTIIDLEWGRNDVLWPMLERFAGITP